jgi:hypothetical protein
VRNRSCPDPAADHRRDRIERLSDGHERDFPGIKGFDDFGKVGEATCETVNLIHNDDIDLLGLNVSE